MSILNTFRRELGLSERDLAKKANVSRETLRASLKNLEAGKVETVKSISHAIEKRLLIAIIDDQPVTADETTIGVGYAVLRDGFDTWKIHFFNLVDAFRRTKDERLILLPPPDQLDDRLFALLASITFALCQEVEIRVPDWARVVHFLEKPWFVSESNSLKAFALVESPMAFRRNNIFVLDNFLSRV